MPSKTPRVVVVGPPASGKTKIGKRVAKLLGVDHIDTDRQIVARHGPIPHIFDTRGEEAFRDMEREAVVEALSSDSVVSLGGGAITREETRVDLAHHTVVGLTISSDAVVHRLNNDKRPLLAGGLLSWEALVSSRRAHYAEVATWSVDVSHRSADDVAKQIVSWLIERDNTE